MRVTLVIVVGLILIVFPPTSLFIAVADIAFILAIVFISMAIQLTPRYSGPRRDLFILSMSLISLAFIILGAFVLTQYS